MAFGALAKDGSRDRAHTGTGVRLLQGNPLDMERAWWLGPMLLWQQEPALIEPFSWAQGALVAQPAQPP